jgi:hypothetical protein
VSVLPRNVSAEEATEMYSKVLAANSSWMANTEKNGRLVAEIFLTDPRISPKRDLKDMKLAVEIASAQLDRVPKEVFVDDPLDKPLSDGKLPLRLDASAFEQRQASREQQKNLLMRLRRFEKWREEHPDA